MERVPFHGWPPKPEKREEWAIKCLFLYLLLAGGPIVGLFVHYHSPELPLGNIMVLILVSAVWFAIVRLIIRGLWLRWYSDWLLKHHRQQCPIDWRRDDVADWLKSLKQPLDYYWASSIPDEDDD